jgi:uncharacterized cupredoxin-like copper-binding protein
VFLGGADGTATLRLETGAVDANAVYVSGGGTDTLRFEPKGLTVAAGETVSFRITNAGLLPHDFTLGDQATQDEHEAMMTQMAAGGMTMPDEPNAVTLAAGETKELTWRFTVPGTVLIGCHQPGHFAVGMVATIEVGG